VSGRHIRDRPRMCARRDSLLYIARRQALDGMTSMQT